MMPSGPVLGLDHLARDHLGRRWMAHWWSWGNRTPLSPKFPVAPSLLRSSSMPVLGDGAGRSCG